MTDGIAVYKAIVAVQSDLAKEGIAKDRTCTQGATYKFRGIDDIYNALAPHLAKNKLCILPRMIRRECVERISKNGGALFYTTVEAEFDFVSAEDGSRHTVRTFGEAMDSGDKGTNKSMSAAYKYAAFQAFCIPTEGDNDSENQTHEVQPRQGKATPAPASQSGSQGKLSATQAKLFPQVIAHLNALFGDDVAAKKKECHAISGMEDYRKLDDDALKNLEHKLRLTVETDKDMPL